LDPVTRKKWDAASAGYDFFNSFGPERRWSRVKGRLYSSMKGRILFLAVGTGLDIKYFPPNQDIVGVDISMRMLEKARPRAREYNGNLPLAEMDARALAFPDYSFDQVFTACTFCSVPEPVEGLREVRRVLRHGGELHMFEHTRSRWFPFNVMLHLMNPVTRRFGPEVTRDTPRNVRRAGFQVRRVRNEYLDVVKTIFAVR